MILVTSRFIIRYTGNSYSNIIYFGNLEKSYLIVYDDNFYSEEFMKDLRVVYTVDQPT